MMVPLTTRGVAGEGEGVGGHRPPMVPKLPEAHPEPRGQQEQAGIWRLVEIGRVGQGLGPGELELP